MNTDSRSENLVRQSRCAAGCAAPSLNRRQFLETAALLTAGTVFGSRILAATDATGKTPGPATTYRPLIHAAFVRRKEAYGMTWPGAVWDGEAARRRFADQITRTAGQLHARLELRPEPIFSLEEGEAWIAAARQAGADGLLVLMHDRQKHAWPTATKAAESGIPTVIWSPLGTSFTTNTVRLADRPGCAIFSTDDTRWLDVGVQLLAGGARVRRARAVIIARDQRRTQPLGNLGIELQYVPASTFIDEYRAMSISPEMERMANDYIQRARRRQGATRDDVINGVKSYFVASRILERERGDAISMDCLGALGNTPISLPCIAWSRMNDDGIPAACEADVGAVAAHIISQFVLRRPGFQQDPVADTADDCLIGAHCSCPTRLRGLDTAPEPYDLIHHHGNRDAIPRTLWPLGERATCLDVLPGTAKSATELLISTGQVIRNIDVPPAGGCVVSVKVKLDGEQPVLSFPGFHQLFILGDFRRELTAFCRLYNLKATVV